jgi:hypothetical protein
VTVAPASPVTKPSPQSTRSEIESQATRETTTTTTTTGPVQGSQIIPPRQTAGGSAGGSTTTATTTTGGSSTPTVSVWPEPAAASASQYTSAQCYSILDALFQSTSEFVYASRSQITQAISIDKLLGTVYSTTDDWGVWKGAPHYQLWQAWDSLSGRDGTGDGHAHTGF